MAESLNTSVIILGGSIVGLCNALFLAQRGVPCILIERHAGSSPHPRAMGWTHRTMELFRTVDGLEAELNAIPSRAGGKPRRVATKTLNDKWDDESHWTNSKPALGIAQDKLEPILRAKAIVLGADLRLGYNMTDWSLNDDDDSVSLTATNSTTGGQVYNSGTVLTGDDDNGKMALAKTPAESRGQPGFRAPHIWLKRGDEDVSSLDLFCGGWVVLSKDPSWKERLGEVEHVECVIVGHGVEEADQGAFEVAFGVDNTGAVLIRPNGYVGARWKDSTALGDVKQVHKLIRHTSS
ncbi:hypothetical protein PG996_008328 [Apiospora saccharicola]|uniref:FAD-binding domain-containing protein n=1 Tax=Apiospora saccharicola TaxID=335842 RepID=A0ABR1UXM0_9PEZI